MTVLDSVGAEFSSTIYVWDLKTRKRILALETPLDFGGQRLQINPRGDICAVGSFKYGGVVCYSTESGELLWFKNKLKQLQVIRYSPDGKQLYCKCERRPLMIFDAETGSEIAQYRAAEDVYCGPYESIELVSKRRPGKIELRHRGGARFATIEQTGFAVHDAAFGVDRVCISEAGGGNPWAKDNAPPIVRCIDTRSGSEIWRYTPRHSTILCLAYPPRTATFVGVEREDKGPGKKRLLRFDPESGKPTHITEIEPGCATEVFCSRGEALLTSEGRLIDTATGVTTKAFRFP